MNQTNQSSFSRPVLPWLLRMTWWSRYLRRFNWNVRFSSTSSVYRSTSNKNRSPWRALGHKQVCGSFTLPRYLRNPTRKSCARPESTVPAAQVRVSDVIVPHAREECANITEEQWDWNWHDIFPQFLRLCYCWWYCLQYLLFSDFLSSP